MKRLMFTAILFLGIGTMVFAQQTGGHKVKRTPEEKAQHLTDALNKRLSLNDGQKSKVYAISLDGIKQFEAKKAKGEKPDRAAMKAELEKRDAQISAILNPDQQKAYQQWKAEKLEKMKKHGHHGKDRKENDKA